MLRLTTLVLAAALAAVACGSSTASGGPSLDGGSPAASGQVPGGNTDCGTAASVSGTYNGIKTTIYCGSAQATITVGGTAYKVKGGQCAYDASIGFGANIGTSFTPTGTVPVDAPQWVSVVQESGSGAIVSGSAGGQTFLISADSAAGGTINIAADHKSGTASGTLLTDDTAVTVAFTC